VSGPQFSLQAYGGGVSTAGSGFFALPEDSGIVYRTRLHWDLTELGENSIAASTFGDGDFELVAPPEQLLQSYYMAGRLGRLPVRGATHGFTAYWLGTPPFDAKREMAWTAQMYVYLRTFFRDTTDDPFRVFVRVLPGQGGYPGTALLNSFMLGTPVGSGDSVRLAPRETLTHEMVHHWAVGIDGAEGTVTWFPEGLATYYARLLPMKAGLDSVSSFLRSVNNTARAYYTSPARNLPADSIGRAGFRVPSARNLPYARGSLYFADLDAQLRAASGGRRRLEDILFPIFDRVRRGERVTQSDFVEALVRDLGPPARAQFEAIIVRGETLVPAANAFGPCFDRKPTSFPVDGKSIDGYEWIRAASVPDDRCRAW
jgi:predicted metalloprotease with PDZ domain